MRTIYDVMTDTPISRTEIQKELYKWFHYVSNGEDVYREYPQYGNRHTRIPIGKEWGSVHWDEHNAISQPISHLARFIHEKTGINEMLLRALGYVLFGYGIYKITK